MSVPQATILIVDDSPTNLLVLNQALRGHFRVKAARNGAAALRIAAADPPDLVLLDQSMPEMDGVEVCARLKADPHTAAVPVVFITADDGPGTRSATLNAGALDLLRKPIDPDLLVMRVRQWVGGRSE